MIDLDPTLHHRLAQTRTTRPPNSIPTTGPEYLGLIISAPTASERAGTVSLGIGVHWVGRHSAHPESVRAAVCAADPEGHPKFRCRCTAGPARCCEHANAGDGQCEACRRWCR